MAPDRTLKIVLAHRDNLLSNCPCEQRQSQIRAECFHRAAFARENSCGSRKAAEAQRKMGLMVDSEIPDPLG